MPRSLRPRSALFPTSGVVRFGPALAGGVALGLSFPPFGLYPLAWVALVPLVLRLRAATSAREVGVEAYAAFLATYAVAFSWPLAHALPQTAFLSLAPLLLLPLAMALPFALAVPVRRRLGVRWGWCFLIATYGVMEGLLSRGPLAFPWGLLGHSQAEALAFNQVAEWTGTAGLTLWVLGLNVTLGAAWAARARRRAAGLTAFALLVLLPFGLSRWLLDRLPAPQRHVAVGLVQPATDPRAWADIYDATRVDHLLALSDVLLDSAEAAPALVLWPETALPVGRTSAERARLYRRLQAWADRADVALLTGAITPTEAAPGPMAYFNSALLFRPGDERTRYDKVRLVPLAERVPFLDRWPWLEALAIPAGGVAGYRPGAAPHVLRVGATRFGVMICFESLFGNDTRHLVEQGADVLVVLTQDGWWGRTAGYRQHLAFNRLRAIETRRAVVQAAVTGTSALILPTGATAFETGWMEQTARLAAVPVHAGPTFYARHGDFFFFLSIAVAALLGLGAAVRKEKPLPSVD